MLDLLFFWCMKLFAKFQQVTQAELFFSSGPVLTLGRFPWLSIRGCSFPLFFPPRDKQIKDTLNCCCFLRSLCGTAGAFGRETKSACVCVCLTTLSSRMWKPRSPKSPEIHWRFVILSRPRWRAEDAVRANDQTRYHTSPRSVRPASKHR